MLVSATEAALETADENFVAISSSGNVNLYSISPKEVSRRTVLVSSDDTAFIYSSLTAYFGVVSFSTANTNKADPFISKNRSFFCEKPAK
jgi:hypothetical protein